MINRIRNNKAFTLIELIIVIAIIGILIAIASPRFTGFTKNAKVSGLKADTKMLEDVSMIYHIEEGKWPVNIEENIDTSDELRYILNGNQIARLDKNQLKNRSKGLKGDLKDYVIVISKGKHEGEIVSLEGQVDRGGVTHYNPRIETGDKMNEPNSDKGPDNNSDSTPDKEPEVPEPEVPGSDRVYSDSEVDDLIKQGYIPIATSEELDNLHKGEEQTFGVGTKWEGNYTSGLENKKYIQVQDVDLSKFDNFNPIGTSSNNFLRSTYDGGGYKISNLTVDGGWYSSLFGVAERSLLLNIGLVNVDIKGKQNTGGLVGSIRNRSSIENSYVTGTVYSTGDNVGGLVGSTSWSSITNSYAMSTVTSDNDNTSRVGGVGGLVGSHGWSSVKNSYSTGVVTGDLLVGGLIGYQNNKSETSNSYTTSTVNGNTKVGGFMGHNNGVVKGTSGWANDVNSNLEGIGLNGGKVENLKGLPKSEIDEIIKSLIK